MLPFFGPDRTCLQHKMRQVHTGTQWRSLAEATSEICGALVFSKKETIFSNDETAFFDSSLDGEED